MRIKIYLFILAFTISTQTVIAQQNLSTKKEDFSDDWAALSKYQKENDTLKLPRKGEKRVVFLGSSIFEFWKQKDPAYFNQNPYVDRGISGQLSPQLLIRFRQDVIDLKPKAVIILAGSNDLASNKGHVSNKTVLDNIKSMVELAKKHHIKVFLCKYLPINEYPWNKSLTGVAEQIISLNETIVNYANENKLAVVDYWTPLRDERDGQKAEYTTDGVHPNLAGYKVMEAVTDLALKKELGRL
ncbi:GDSL-type esterase/lipase family protein [Pedobacter sandarakinus]|uniref:GDSL-type esterase/lipase family protein n=1 Tax=Pedobacter sandarakinus TaxID=353156 RepID=UPI00224839C7|nr:GDSL-type esterase/lipase family protein [Pedobacter sandarakinus]MCX2575613.1 GDSL-type esterase/lipase family protein [Pedobacter sandarakinus]